MAFLKINGQRAAGIPSAQVTGELRNIALSLGWKQTGAWYYTFNCEASQNILEAGRKKIFEFLATCPDEDRAIVIDDISAALRAHKSLILSRIVSADAEEVSKALDLLQIFSNPK